VDTPPDEIAVLVATSLEARAVRRHARGARVVDAGIALAKLRRGESFGVAISCGLAGGLDEDHPTGTVLIPDSARTSQGTWRTCDVEWTARLRDAARRLGYAPLAAPLLTSDTLVTGNARRDWARKGFAGADMETALIVTNRLAAVRVILDTPRTELSPDWLNPARALLLPRNWRQATWLAREGPRCADVAARIVALALDMGSG
jgi:hypothetical protein